MTSRVAEPAPRAPAATVILRRADARGWGTGALEGRERHGTADLARWFHAVTQSTG